MTIILQGYLALLLLAQFKRPSFQRLTRRRTRSLKCIALLGEVGTDLCASLKK